MTTAKTVLKLAGTGSRGGFVVIHLKDAADNAYEVNLTSVDVASLMAAIRAQLDVALLNAASVSMPGMKRVQYVETPEAGYFRVFLTDHLFHEYPVQKGTTLADELKIFEDRAEARNDAKATHRLPDSSSDSIL